jgi:hypothetical protein
MKAKLILIVILMTAIPVLSSAQTKSGLIVLRLTLPARPIRRFRTQVPCRLLLLPPDHNKSYRSMRRQW